jgi:PfaD family protein
MSLLTESWSPGTQPPAFGAAELLGAVPQFREPMHVVREGARGRVGVALGGEVTRGTRAEEKAWPLLATLPALYPEWLGDRSFGEVHRVRFPYVAGEMANGIATTRLVVAMAKAGMLGFFGAAGLGPERVEKSLDELEGELGDRYSWGINLIHSPNEPALEERVADLLIRRSVVRASASAFMALTPAVVRYAVAGLSVDASGRIARKHHLFAKLSRTEVARRFLSPAPADILQALVGRGLITTAEAKLAEKVPVAEDVTVEADSGGHTDNQALTALLPMILQLRDELEVKHGYQRPIRVGAAGGLGTPAAVAAAFQLGAAYVLTGSINQSAVESGLSEAGKKMLCQAEITDVVMAPAADMFELGVKVQVLKRGTLFALRAQKLYETYMAHASLEAIPSDVRARLEKEVLGTSIDAIWTDTRKFWSGRDGKEVVKAEADPRHKMALVFRWYLGRASRWAIDGDPARRLDYQIWCGPAMGAFNAWVKGSFLEEPANRSAAQIARNLLEGAAVVTRAQQLRSYGVPMPPAAFQYPPRPLA